LPGTGEKSELYWKFAPYDKDGKGLDVGEIAERIADWSIHFFKERHIKSGQVPDFHKEVYRDLASDYKYIVITAPSEFSKTTICSLIYPLYRNVYFNEPYTVICTRTDDAAMELLDEVKYELRYNEELKEVYGILLPMPDEKTKERYKKKDSAHVIELDNGTVIRSIPMRGQIRARKRGGYRVTLFILDDPEEVDDLDSPTVLDKNMRWLDRSAIPRMDKDFGKARVLGTRIGYNCTIDKLLKRKRWMQRNYKALVPDDIPMEKRVSIWELRWPTEFLHKERMEYTQEGRLADWMWERMNEPPVYLQKNLKGYQFWRGRFERKNEQNLLWLDGLLDPIPVFTYHAIDPAFSQAESADERAQISFAMGYLPMGDWRKPCIWELEYDFDYKDPDILIERAMDLHKKYYYQGLIVEANGCQRIYDFMAVKALAKDPFMLNHPLTLTPITYQHSGKEDRIYHYFKNIIRLQQLFIHPDHAEIQVELDNFLNAPHLHILDAFEMGGRYAYPSNEDANIQNPKSRTYQRAIEDKLEKELELEGKQYLLW
jgi:hypothetical protein